MTQKYRYLVDLRSADMTEDDKKWIVLDYEKKGEDKSIGALEIRAQLNDKDAQIAAITTQRDALFVAMSEIAELSSTVSQAEDWQDYSRIVESMVSVARAAIAFAK